MKMADVVKGLQVISQVSTLTAFIPAGAATYVAAVGFAASALYGYFTGQMDISHALETFLVGTGFAGVRRAVTPPAT